MGKSGDNLYTTNWAVLWYYRCQVVAFAVLTSVPSELEAKRSSCFLNRINLFWEAEASLRTKQHSKHSVKFAHMLGWMIWSMPCQHCSSNLDSFCMYSCVCRPLIRILGDRFPWQVKSAILSTLTIIIMKGGIALKPFLPQLQTTFVKCLQDNNRSVLYFSMSFSVMLLPPHMNMFELQVCPDEGCSCPRKA